MESKKKKKKIMKNLGGKTRKLIGKEWIVQISKYIKDNEHRVSHCQEKKKKK